ncbi:hypothetical protein RCH12_003114 [Cryobacterium sp. MP_3.1]|uniref:DUF6545 domain-containing protein n=1 Tax=Cryobacterium sp. MP_3.1 TaxID=3071711 RepID=UPI002E094393|nr:hypothetical protein [Cryobacterium sp. MP_3.1]
MTAIIVATAMWLLAASLLILRRGRSERNITYAALTIAVAMTLNTDPVYRPLDRLAGGGNLVTLVADVALMIGVFFLGRGVMKASERQPKTVRLALGRVALVTAILGAAVAFSLIDLGGTTTSFMLELGDQPAAAVYSMIQFVYYGIVLSAMAVLAARQFRNSEGVQKLPPASLFIGSLLGVGLSVVVIAMDIAHVFDELVLMAEIAVTYEPLRLLAFLFLCVGFAGQPAARSLQARSRERRTRKLVDDLRPIWAEATKARPGISQNQQVAIPADEPDIVLHRQVVEIRDAMIDTRVNFAVSEPERELIERAELHLVGAGPAGSLAAALPTTTRNRKMGR